MPKLPKDHLDWLRSWYADLVDTRRIDDTFVRALVYFEEKVVGPHPEIGLTITGYSIRQREVRCILCVKGDFAGIPRVAFVTERTNTDCILVFVRKWLNDTLEWNHDKYA